MAQPAYAIKYLGAIRASANTPYTTASILAIFPTATVAKIKMDAGRENIKVGISIDNYPMIIFGHNDEQYIQTGQTFTFDTDVTIAVGIYKAVV